VIPRIGLVALSAVLASGSLGCTAIVGIEDRSGTWCTLEGTGHDFCEDFDHGRPFEAWTATGSPETTPSGQSEPNALKANVGTSLTRPFPELRGPMTLALDLQTIGASELPGGGGEEPSTYDVALVLVARQGAELGLLVDARGSMWFGSSTAIPTATPDVPASAEWRHFAIIYDEDFAKQGARLEVNGRVVKTAPPPLPGEPDNPLGALIAVGARRLGDKAGSVVCAIDNVTVDGPGAADQSQP
jgi:hypothetical protein